MAQAGVLPKARSPEGVSPSVGRQKAARGKGPVPALHLTIACKRRPIASARASLRLSGAPETWR